MSSTTEFASRQAQARSLVQEIARSHGYLGEEVLGRMDADTRRQVEEALLTKDEMIGTSVITLAKNLYSTNVRFIFELLQNADDNHFTRAASLNAVPYVSFHVYHDRIVVDCNEDGFNEENIRAICNIGKSSKTGAQGYIGEKGIGFKSVFKVAWKVEIQSGAYSFSFTHRQGDSGFGMMSPEWFVPAQELPAPLTRMTLYLHGNDDASGGPAQRQNILDQLNELKPAMLLFLKKLKRIDIKIYGEDGNETISATSLSIHQIEPSRRVLERVHIENENTELTRQKYHIVESTARNLPRNENRNYSAQEESSKAYSTAPVVLAFPLSDDDVPVLELQKLEPQELFAFLPVRRVGFNFLIHSDFVTQANREDIVTTSSRNIQLLDVIADSFVVGMRQLCQHPSLKYQWMRYLPKLVYYPWDPFWRRLVDKIKERISNEEILILRNSPTIVRISRAKRITRDHCDNHNTPLFDDLPGSQACYISPVYQFNDLAILQEYGLGWLDHADFLLRVKRDLSLPTSRLRITTDDEWQTHAARSLNLSFQKEWSAQIRETRKLELVPLTCGKRVNTINGAVYFAATSGGHLIPSDLGYRLVDPKAARLPERKKLFENLGIKQLSDGEVRTAILRKYERTKSNGIDLEISISHIRFLYLTCYLIPLIDEYPNLYLFNSDGKLHPLKDHAFYFRDTDAYGLWSLLSKTDKSPNWSNIHFLHEKYEDAMGIASQEDWKRWLKSLGVRQYPRLVKDFEADLSESTLSEECRFVAEHLPSELLGFLKYGWEDDGKFICEEMFEELDELKALKVPCQGGRMVALSGIYLPSPNLLAKRDQFMRYGEAFPFVDIESTLGPQWDFLKKLGVRDDLDLRFYLRILENIDDDPTDPSRIPHLYLQIQSECANQNAAVQGESETTVRTFIDSKSRVFIPSYEGMPSSWSSPQNCLLDAPAPMKTKCSVLPRYRDAFPKSNIDFSILRKFFDKTLRITKCSWEHVVDELKNMQQTDDCQAALSMYKELQKMKFTDTSTNNLRNAFDNDNLGLVYANEKWYKPSQCLWSSTSTPIRGRVNLSDAYEPEFEQFFVEVLGVRGVDANLVYNELLELKPTEASVGHVKDLIWNLNSLLEIEHPNFSKLPLLPLRFDGRAFLPLFDNSEFAILDRKPLVPIFGDKITLLDFTYQEVFQLKPFIEWAGLEDRYLSRLVKETSTLDSSDKLPISDASQDVRTKAYGLYRIATHLKSPRIQQNGQDLYDLLRMSRTWETQRIESTLSVKVGLVTVTESVDIGDIHIDDADGLLQIYVPHDEGLRYDSYISTLPKRLVHWMMTDPATNARQDVDPIAMSLVQTVLQARGSFVNRYLDNEGVIDVAVPDLEEDIHTDLSSAIAALTLAPALNIAPSSAPSPASTPRLGPVTPQRGSSPLSIGSSSDGGYFEQETPATDLTSLSSPRPRRSRSRASFSQDYLSPDPFTSRTAERQRRAAEEYCELLSQVAAAARKSRLLSTPFDLSDLAAALEGDVPTMKTFNEYDLFGAGMSQFERDRRVGAAGELFVFELLGALNPSLRGFTRDNWRSTIRKYVTEHPDYADMGGWTGIETSDLEYEDRDGTLTEALVHKGHLQARWRTRRPKYYIEVKATPGHWDNAFFMSHAQHEKMRSFSTDDSVYVIFRVFNLYTDAIGCNVYVDPAKLEQEGRLVFTADRWTVKPQ
ncbi:hypothetical protein F4818DRAFT_443468 [Hypoxylon cercidicola]|nr:hypothetical protein F4818DRAFT_443468 [Hypoxylon cercidicola]